MLPVLLQHNSYGIGSKNKQISQFSPTYLLKAATFDLAITNKNTLLSGTTYLTTAATTALVRIKTHLFSLFNLKNATVLSVQPISSNQP